MKCETNNKNWKKNWMTFFLIKWNFLVFVKFQENLYLNSLFDYDSFLFFLTILHHIFWIYIFHCVYMINIVSSFQNSIIHLELIIFNMTSTKFIAKWVIKKLIMLVFNMILHLKSIYILWKIAIIIIQIIHLYMFSSQKTKMLKWLTYKTYATKKKPHITNTSKCKM
jgi:hypothetical protein